MFANFIYFIIALLVYSTYLPTSKSTMAPGTTFLVFGLLIYLFGYLTWVQFKSLQRQIHTNSIPRLDHRFNSLVTRQSIMAIALFAVNVHGLSLPLFFMNMPLFAAIPTLLAVIFLSLFIFYLAIVWTIAYGVYKQIYPSGFSRRSYVWSQISFSVPVLLPWVVISGIYDLINALPFSGPKKILATPEGQVVSFILFLALLVIFVPAMIQRFWGCKPVEDGLLRKRIEGLCRKAGIEYANILYWPIFGGRMITAGVMGLVKKFRYILVTNALIQTLEPQELDAVIAHEIGHVKKKHLLFYVFFFIGFIFFMLLANSFFTVINFIIVYSKPFYRFITSSSPYWTYMFTNLTYLLLMITTFLVYFRFVFGFFMRNFERQADCYVYALFDNAQPLISTLEKIAIHSGQSPDRPNWHHYSIKERIDYLKKCESDRRWITMQDRKIRKSIIIYILSILTVGSIGYGFNFSDSAERITNQYLEKRLLADCKLSIDIYEKFLSAEPDNPTALNNLAWVYATCEDTRLQNPQRALMLAKKAALIIEEPHILDTLAESYYINGYHEEAIAAATRALRLARENLSYYEEQLTKFKQAGGH